MKKPLDDDPHLVGLAMSGGGIRSATFCLGVVQTLARRGLLRLCDYMCTVSGGGYVGACLSSLMTIWEHGSGDGSGQRPLGQDRAEPAQSASPVAGRPWDKQSFGLGPNMPLLRTHQVHHLRKHGDLLMLRSGLLHRSVLRGLGAVLLGLACSLSLFAAFLAVAVGLFVFLAGCLVGPEFWSWLTRTGSWPGWSEAVWALAAGSISSAPWGLWAYSFLVGGLLVVPFWLWTMLRRPVSAVSRSGQTRYELGERGRLGWFTATLLAAMLLLALGDWSFWGRWPVGLHLPGLVRPLAVAAGALAANSLLYLLLALCGFGRRWQQVRRAVFGAMEGICFCALVGSAAFIVLVLATWWYLSQPGCGWLPAVMVAAAVAARMLAWPAAVRQYSSSPRVQALAAAAGKLALRGALALFLITALLCVARALLLVPLVPLSPVTMWLAALAWFLVLGFLIDFNRISLHFFYRDRLAEAYLQTEARGPGGLELVRDDYGLTVARLHDRADQSPAGSTSAQQRGGDESPPANPAPYHLIQCAVNLAGSRDLARRDRKSDYFLFSKYYCGSATTGYVPTAIYDAGQTKLAAAITISGAAASSGLGSYTSLPVAFAMTLFNTRLGYWMPNPRYYPGQVVYPFADGVSWRPPPGDAPRRPVGPLRRLLGHFWPYYLFREMLALTDARSQRVNLSDGGHTGDNLGLYPLLQRRCKLIIVCDAEWDPNYSFNGLAAAVQQIYTDEGVEVEIELNRMRPASQGGRPRAAFAVGRITYPVSQVAPAGHDSGDPHRTAATDADTPPSPPDRYGWLIYLKAAFLNQYEAATVKSYAARHPDFPHQSTADQFFSDDQFEAYRALGARIAEVLLASPGLELTHDVDDDRAGPEAQRLIDWCRTQFEAEGARPG